MKIDLTLDSRSVKQIGYLNGWAPHWTEHLHNDLERELAETVEAYFKPMLKSKRGNGTGESENSVRREFTSTGDGVEIVYYGSLGAFYMDEGNFPADQTLWAPIGNVKKAFPVGKRDGGDITFSPFIHGMGHRTSGVPTHYSDKTAQWLENGKALDIAEDMMSRWFDSVVIGA